MFERTLIVVAHPDDEILGCGGLLAKISSISEIRVVFIAEGSSCRYNLDETEEISEAIIIRSLAARKSLGKFGVGDIHFENNELNKLKVNNNIDFITETKENSKNINTNIN